MTFTEFNESLDNRLNDLSELSEKYNIFNESVSEQLNINIEKAKVYVEESKGTEEDLEFLIKEAKEEADSKYSAALGKLQKSTVDAFDGMADDLSAFADSAKLSVAMDKLKANKELADKKVSVVVTKSTKALDKARSDVMAKLAVLEANVNAALSADELHKLDAEVNAAFREIDAEVNELNCKAAELINVYIAKLNEVKGEVSADKNISKKMSGVSADKDKWAKRSSDNKNQIMSLVNKLTSIMNKKVKVLKSDIAKVSAAIKGPAAEEKKEEPKHESTVNVSDLLNTIIEEQITEMTKEEEKTEPDEADKILATIESEIAASKEGKIDEVQEITFNESTDVDAIVDDLLTELM